MAGFEMIKKIDESIITSNLEKALKSDRKRSIFCLHDENDTLQRMVNTCLKGTYVRPHKHENPDKLEIFLMLTGKVAIFIFDDSGKIKETIALNSKGPVFGIEIPPKTWHSFVVLSKNASMFEIIEGKYESKSHKAFPSWAPEEGNVKESKRYLEFLKKSAKIK